MPWLTFEKPNWVGLEGKFVLGLTMVDVRIGSWEVRFGGDEALRSILLGGCDW